MLKNKFIIGFLLMIPLMNVLFYFLAKRKEGVSITGEDIAISIVGFVYVVFLILFVVHRARRKTADRDK